MSAAVAVLPDPIALAERLRRLGMVDSPVRIANTPEVFGYAFSGLHTAAAGAESAVSASVLACFRGGGYSRLEVQVSANAEKEPAQIRQVQAHLFGVIRGLYLQAGQALPKSIAEFFTWRVSSAAAPPDVTHLQWDLGLSRFEWDICDEDEALTVLTATLWRPLTSSEWLGWLGPDDVLEGANLREQDDRAHILSRVASVLEAHRHSLAQHAANMHVVLTTDDGNGGTRTVLQLREGAGASIWCDERQDEVLVQIIHPGGSLEQLRG